MAFFNNEKIEDMEYEKCYFYRSKKNPPILKAVEKEYEFCKEKIENNNLEGINLLYVKFLAYALDCRDFAKNIANINLQFSEDDVYIIERLAQAAHESYLNKILLEDNVMNFAKIFAGYLGFIITYYKGGEWIDEVKGLEECGPAIKLDEKNSVFVLSKVYRRITMGPEDNLEVFYGSIPYKE